MAWDAQGKWIPDDKVPTEAAPVQQQQQSLTGLMAGGGVAKPSTTNGPGSDSGMARPSEATPPGAQTLGGPASTPGNVTTTAATGQPGDVSVENRLNGLLSSDSPYMKLARTAGERSAARRGLLNSSIAGGASEAAAIAAAAPIASQDAQQEFQKQQTQLEGDLQLRNAKDLQTQQDLAAKDRLGLELGNRIDLQKLGDVAAMERLVKEGDLNKILEQMRERNDLTQTQINANVALMSNYMQAFATLSQNPEIPAAARDAYMREFLRVTQSGSALVNALSGTTITWPSGNGNTGGGTTTPTTPTTTTPDLSHDGIPHNDGVHTVNGQVTSGGGGGGLLSSGLFGVGGMLLGRG